MIALNQGEELGWASIGVPVGIFASFIVSHLALRKFAPAADPAILPICFALSSIGIAFVTRLAPDLAVRQVAWLVLGIIFMIAVIIFMKNMDKTANYKYTLMVIGLILLLSPLLPGIGNEIYGSRIWLSIGSFSFQPGEIAKIFIVLFLAGYLAQNREMLSVFTHKVGPFKFPDLSTLLPLLIMWLLSMAIVVFEKDLGSALIVYFVFLTMLYVASGKKFYLIVGLLTIAIGAVILFFFFSHVQVRVDTWLDPFADPTNTGYQLVQSIFSMADGGLFGVGIGSGLADNIPIVESDFIFAAIAEETGLLGAAGLLLLYLCFAIPRPRHCCTRKIGCELLYRGWSYRHDRAAGIHHRWRRYAPHPSYRSHTSLRKPRWLFATRELHRCGLLAQVWRSIDRSGIGDRIGHRQHLR